MKCASDVRSWSDRKQTADTFQKAKGNDDSQVVDHHKLDHVTASQHPQPR